MPNNLISLNVLIAEKKKDIAEILFQKGYFFPVPV